VGDDNAGILPVRRRQDVGQKGKEVNVRAIHKQDAGLVIASRNPDASDMLVYGDVTISFSAMEVHRGGQLVALTRKEFKTLAYLFNNARRVISRDELLSEVWGMDSIRVLAPSTTTFCSCARNWSQNRPGPNTFERCVAWDTSSWRR
jgi:DNA-binding response OmpR family regulator